jgi:hypothetical protein
MPDIEQGCSPYQIYYINNYPYVCNYLQPDILMPLYVIQSEEQQQNTSRNVRFAAELVSAVGNVVEEQVANQVATLENYVKKMEEEAIQNATEKIKTSCYGFCK